MRYAFYATPILGVTVGIDGPFWGKCGDASVSGGDTVASRWSSGKITVESRWRAGPGTGGNAVPESVLIDLDFHPQQRRAQCFALRIGAQRNRASAIQRLMQHKIQRMQIGKLIALDSAAAQLAK